MTTRTITRGELQTKLASKTPVILLETLSAASYQQAVPLDTNVSVGQAPAVPVHVSATSHSPADARHVVPLATSVQVAEQQEPDVPFAAPSSQLSPDPTIPSPHCCL